MYHVHCEGVDVLDVNAVIAVRGNECGAVRRDEHVERRHAAVLVAPWRGRKNSAVMLLGVGASWRVAGSPGNWNER